MKNPKQLTETGLKRLDINGGVRAGQMVVFIGGSRVGRTTAWKEKERNHAIRVRGLVFAQSARKHRKQDHNVRFVRWEAGRGGPHCLYEWSLPQSHG